MYRVIIAEDELNVREGIAKTVDFAAAGFSLCGMCENGREALALMEKHRPELVITDIRMPVMDGIALAEEAKERFPKTKIVFLTGHSEFEYAKAAVALKVNDYVLKPISAKILRELLARIKQELDHETEELQKLTQMENKLTRSEQIMREDALRAAVSGQLPPEALTAEVGISPHRNGYRVLIFCVDRLAEAAAKQSVTPKDINASLAQLAGEISGADGTAFAFENTVLILNDGTKAERMANKIQREASLSLGVSLSVYVSDQEKDLAALPALFQKTAEIAALNAMIEDGSVIFTEGLGKGESMPEFHAKRYNAEFVKAIRQGQGNEAKEVVCAMLDHMRRKYLSYARINVYIHDMAADAAEAVEELTETCADNLRTFSIPEISDSVSPDEVKASLLAFTELCISCINSAKGGFSRLLMERAEEYIRANFASQNLSLSDVCDFLSVSQSYFSALFKAKYHKTFLEYLTDLRIEKAKSLLATTDFKLYEIAERSGYADPHYFSVIFKKHTGMTPKDYRNEKHEIHEKHSL